MDTSEIWGLDNECRTLAPMGKDGRPHKGWTCDYVTDIGKLSTPVKCVGRKRSSTSTLSAIPIMILLTSVCICSERMTEDYSGPKRREATLHNRTARGLSGLLEGGRFQRRATSTSKVDGRNLGVILIREGSAGSIESMIPSRQGSTRRLISPSSLCSMSSIRRGLADEEIDFARSIHSRGQPNPAGLLSFGGFGGGLKGIHGLKARRVALVSISGCHWSYPTSVWIPSTTRPRQVVEVPGQEEFNTGIALTQGPEVVGPPAEFTGRVRPVAPKVVTSATRPK